MGDGLVSPQEPPIDRSLYHCSTGGGSAAAVAVSAGHQSIDWPIRVGKGKLSWQAHHQLQWCLSLIGHFNCFPPSQLPSSSTCWKVTWSWRLWSRDDQRQLSFVKGRHSSCLLAFPIHRSDSPTQWVSRKVGACNWHCWKRLRLTLVRYPPSSSFPLRSGHRTRAGAKGAGRAAILHCRPPLEAGPLWAVVLLCRSGHSISAHN